MKITKKQSEELTFLTKHFCSRSPTEEEIHEYIHHTVHGAASKTEDKMSTNVLRNAKQRLDINVQLWKEDLTKGFLSVHELLEDFTDPYGTKLVHSLTASITADYRKELLCDEHGNAKTEYTILAVTNFPGFIPKFMGIK